MLRLLNGLAQMNTSQFYSYEKKILWHAMELFCDYYIEEIHAVNEDTLSTTSKIELLDDIEEAICQMSDVYKNLVDSTSNSDRQMFTSLSVDTSMYDLSPKILAFYSSALETLVEIFNQREFYAFLLHPSLKRDIETISLFEKRDKPGKVVLIYLPEKRIEDQNEIWIYLLHEAYHVLSRRPRNRKYRFVTFGENMASGVKQLLFFGVEFSKNDDRNHEIKEILMNKWFTLDEELNKFKKYDEEDRKFYSSFVIESQCKCWREYLVRINNTLARDLINIMAKFADDSKSDMENSYELCEQLEIKIRSNIFIILAEDMISKIADQYMFVYREVYADIACILTAGVDPTLYEEAFRHAVLFSEYEENDVLREFRMLVVAKSIAKIQGIDYNGWDKYAGEKEGNFYSCLSSRDSPTKTTPDIIAPKITNQDLKSYEKYADKCTKDFYNFIKEKKEIRQFREIIKNSNLTEILSGAKDEQLTKLALNEKESYVKG